jgi:hypothetical protein
MSAIDSRLPSLTDADWRLLEALACKTGRRRRLGVMHGRLLTLGLVTRDPGRGSPWRLTKAAWSLLITRPPDA